MAAVRTKRLAKELSTVHRELTLGQLDPILELEPTTDTLEKWTAVIKGPDDSAYAGYKFRLAITIPSQYPMVAPEVRFVTKVFHWYVFISYLPLTQQRALFHARNMSRHP